MEEKKKNLLKVSSYWYLMLANDSPFKFQVKCLWGKSMQSAIGLGKTEDLIKWECVRYICIQRGKAQAFGAICMSTNKSPNLLTKNLKCPQDKKSRLLQVTY